MWGGFLWHSGEVLSCVILSPTRFGKSSTSLRGDKLLPHPWDQALTPQPPACSGVCCFSIISFVPTVKQKPSVMFPCPLNLTSPPPVSPWWFPQPMLLLCRAGHVWLAFIPRADWLSAGLGIFVPGCAVGHKRCPPADKLCWMGTEMIERSLGMLGSRYHSSLMALLKLGALLAIFSRVVKIQFYIRVTCSEKRVGTKVPKFSFLWKWRGADRNESFKKQNVPTSQHFHTLSHSCTSVCASTWGMLMERNEQLGGSRRSQRKEEGEKTISFSGNIISFQVHIKLWAHCTLILVPLLLKQIYRHICLAWFIVYFLPEAKKIFEGWNM